MGTNEIIQWSIVSIIVLGAIVWLAVWIIAINKKKGTGCNCGCCSESQDCKAQELKDMLELKKQSKSCRDGQSAKN